MFIPLNEVFDRFLIVSKHLRESLIRTAFQSLQLVVTDFLPIMPCYCLQISVTTAAKFGLQQEELNISLTAVGLLVRTFCCYIFLGLVKQNLLERDMNQRLQSFVRGLASSQYLC